MSTINLQDVAPHDAKYMGEATRATIESLPASAWAALVEAVTELQGGSDSVPGIDCDIVTTHETLADFDASRTGHWSERGERTEHTFAGLPAVRYDRFQLFKGKPRASMIVVDCGDLRAALTIGG